MKERTTEFTPSLAQEQLLERLNTLLARAEPVAAGPSRLPVILVVGAPRSGTTLLTQWLAASQQVTVPSNFVARFPKAPHIALMLQRLLTDPHYDFHGELLSAERGQVQWTSDVGKTKGLLAPHEFSWFWRRFIPLDQAAPLPAELRRRADWQGLSREIRKFEDYADLPFAAKGILVQYELATLQAAIPHLIVLHSVRDPLRNAASLLRARRRTTGDDATWFSVEPPGTEWLRGQTPHTQVAGQVLCTTTEINRATDQLPNGSVVRSDHGEFCRRPDELWSRLRAACARFGYDLGPHAQPRCFQESMDLGLPEEDVIQLREGLRTVNALLPELVVGSDDPDH